MQFKSRQLFKKNVALLNQNMNQAIAATPKNSTLSTHKSPADSYSRLSIAVIFAP
jgi:hypothetical protein